MKKDESACRTTVRERSDSRCERCPVMPAVQMHHRKNRSQGGRWLVSNILHLCVDCHKYITEHPADAYDNGWSVKQHHDPFDIPVLYRGAWVYLDDLGNMKRVQEELG